MISTEILPELLQGTSLQSFQARIIRAGDATLDRIKLQLRASEMEMPVAEWDSEEDTVAISAALTGEGMIAEFEAKGTDITGNIRAGVYRGDIIATYSDGLVVPIKRIQINVKGAYTR